MAKTAGNKPSKFKNNKKLGPLLPIQKMTPGVIPSLNPFPWPTNKSTGLPEPVHKGLFRRALSAAKKHFKFKSETAPKYMIHQWAIDWYVQQGGKFKNDGANFKTMNAHENGNFSMLLFAKKLTTTKRNSLPDSDFAVITKSKTGKKVRKYPVFDLPHAINALSRVDATGDATLIKKVKTFVYKRYPHLKKTSKTKATYGNAVHNLQVFSNTLKMLASDATLTVTPVNNVVCIVANENTRLNLKTKAFFQPEAKFKKVITKLTHSVRANSFTGKKTLSPIMQAHHTSMANYHLNEAHKHQTLGNTHADAAKAAEDAGHTNEAAEHTQLVDYHRKQAAHHENTFRDHHLAHVESPYMQHSA